MKKAYAVMCVKEGFAEQRVGAFEAESDREAKEKFKTFWPEGKGYLQYKLYRLIDMVAGK